MEHFISIDGYNDKYLVSSKGTVLRFSHWTKGYFPMNGWIDERGYRRVQLSGKVWLVHRLVALHFIPNPCGKDTVNHINEDKLDNRVENLEWLTNTENHNYGTRNARVGKAHEKPLLRISKENGEILQRYPCLKAAVADGYNHSAVSRCANGIKLKSSGGFVWRWED